MKDTRAGGGAIACKWLKMNELRRAVSGFHAEPGFFAGKKSPLQARESTGGDGYLSYLNNCSIGYIRFQSNNDGL